MQDCALIYEMISKDTPYKLAEIIRDTWPNLFHLRPKKKSWECTTQSTVTETSDQTFIKKNYKPKV